MRGDFRPPPPFPRRRRRFFSSPPSAAAVGEGGNLGSGVGHVYRVWFAVAGGGVWEGAASAWSAFWSPRIWLLLAGAACSGDGSVGVPPRGWRSDGVVLVKWGSRPRAFCRRAAASSIDGARPLRYVVWRSPVSSFPSRGEVVFPDGGGGRPGGFLQVLVISAGRWWLLLGIAAVVCSVCWLWIWCPVADGSWCWVWRRDRSRHVRSSSMIPSTAAGGSRLQLWRFSLPPVLWWPAFFFAGDGVGEKLVCLVFWLICSVRRRVVALSLAVDDLYGVRLLLCLYPLLC